MRRFKDLSIKVKAVLVVVFALLLGFIVYSAVFTIGDNFIAYYYLNPERESKLVTEFQEYVSDNKISSTQSSDIQKWCKQKKNLYCMVFKDDELHTLIDSKNIFTYQDSEVVVTEQYSSTSIKFSDTECKVAIIEYSEDAITTIINIFSFGIAALVVLLCIIYYLTRLTKVITSLSRQALEASSNVNHKIVLNDDANDEIGELYHSIEKMRNDIISHYEKEQESANANRELIANMSHDIRTPLTSIIGYNEIMLRPNNTIEEMRQYASFSLEKAKQLKAMSDKLFQYAVVYDNDTIEVNKECFDAGLLLQQLIGEQIIIAKQNGFDTTFNCDIEDVEISTDALLLKRVFDNTFSNISKYADKTKPVKINVSNSNGMVEILIINYINPRANKSESTQIGIKSCTKIMSALGGKIDFSINDDIYITDIYI